MSVDRRGIALEYWLRVDDLHIRLQVMSLSYCPTLLTATVLLRFNQLLVKRSQFLAQFGLLLSRSLQVLQSSPDLPAPRFQTICVLCHDLAIQVLGNHGHPLRHFDTLIIEFAYQITGISA